MVVGLITGFGVGVVALSVLMLFAVQRARRQSAERLVAQDETIADLRLELAEDKENNRRLRHELHSLSSAGAGSASRSSATDVDEKMEALAAERDQARAELADVRMALESTRSRLEDREAKLTEYREAVKEIRLSLEAQDNLRDIIVVTQDVPANAPAGE